MTDLSHISAIALFGGQLTDACLARAPELKAVGGVLDNWGHRSLPVDGMFERDIPIIDGTRAWAASVAEITLALTLNALRMIPQWHKRMASGDACGILNTCNFVTIQTSSTAHWEPKPRRHGAGTNRRTDGIVVQRPRLARAGLRSIYSKIAIG